MKQHDVMLCTFCGMHNFTNCVSREGGGDFLLSDALDVDVKSTATLLYKYFNAARLV